MVTVSAAKFSREHCQQLVNKFSNLLTPEMHKRMLGFKSARDGYLFLLGKVLLLHSLRELGQRDFTLRQIKYNRFQRPYCEGPVDFNLSHAGDYVFCVASPCYKVGIDIELIKKINLLEYRECFNEEEFDRILRSASPNDMLHFLWTCKEAAIKADGRGLTIQLNSVEVHDSLARIGEDRWYLHSIPFSVEYFVTIACDVRIDCPLTLQFFDVAGVLMNLLDQHD